MSSPLKIANIFEFIKKGKSNGVASLDEDVKVPLEQLPISIISESEFEELSTPKMDNLYLIFLEEDNG